MIIQITNPKTKQAVEFYDHEGFSRNIGTPEPFVQQQANINGKYGIRSHSGIQGLPANNNIANTGIGQHGDTFLSNRYSRRQIIIDYYAYDTHDLAQTLYMDNEELIVKIFTNYNEYETKGYIVGRYDGGSLEIQCDPFYTIPGIVKYTAQIPVHDGGREWLPLTMPRVWFRDIDDKYTFDLNVGISAEPKITINGRFTNVEISNNLGNQKLKLSEMDVKRELEISLDENQEIIIRIDGFKARSDEYMQDYIRQGLYIDLLNGKNELSFKFEDRDVPVTVTIEYQEVTAYVQ